jgi:hypothetical protein
MSDKNRSLRIKKKEEIMRFKILSVVFVFVLIFVIFAVGDSPQNPQTKMKITGTGFERMVRDGTYTEDEIIKIFKCKNVQLAQWYKLGKFEEIGQYFGCQGIISTDTGVTFEGVDAIGNCFKNIKEKLKVSAIEFETKLVIICELTKELNKPKDEWKDNDLVDRIYEYITFSFNSPGGGSGVAGGGHIRACDI